VVIISAANRRKVFVVGLDGATLDLIKPWASEGHLPTFRKMLEEGVHGPLLSTVPFATIPAWPSFATGVNPGKHGFYDFFKEKKNSYELTVETFPSKAIKRPAIWDILSRHGYTVGLVNIPGTYPPKKVNGYMITDMFTPPNARFTYPDGFQEELLREIGNYRVFFSHLSSKNVGTVLEDLRETLQMRIKAALYLLRKDLDFVMVVDNGTDRAEHEFWRFIDPQNPLFNQEELKKYGNPLLEYYRQVDAALEVLLKAIDNDTVVFIMSDHGQGPLRKFINLNVFLIEEGFMRVKRNLSCSLRYSLFKNGYHPKNVYKILQKLGVERLATDRVTQETRLRLLNRLFFSTSDIDWEKTKAFACGVTGAIRINVEGREPCGNVQWGSEYEKVRDELIDKLSRLSDPENKQLVIEKVYLREQIYFGPYLQDAPDLICVAKDGYEFFGMHGFTFSRVIDKTFGNSGSHRPYGTFLALGKDVRRNSELKNAAIIDLAPTILHIFDVPIPRDLDGKVLFDIFEKGSIPAQKEPRYDSSLQMKKVREKIKSLKQAGKL